ncbi:hypothetical protein OAE56_03720, partial [Verrucomicrobiales bacterium]|nr:hypothetical protein [Verrucomicrobiales bacterium]
MKHDHTNKDQIHREELYRLIWKKPATKIAKDYDISGSMLTRICRELDVPKPKVGHWAKVAHGKNVKRPPLPALKEGGKSEWKINRTIADEQKAIAKARKDVPVNPVSPEIQKLLEVDLEEHQWIKLTRTATKGSSLTNEGRVTQKWDKRHFSVETSTEHFERALTFLNRIIHLAEAEGMQIEYEKPEKQPQRDRWGYYQEPRPCQVGRFCWEGECIGFRIFEKFTRSEKEDKNAWPRYNHTPTGLLEFALFDACGYSGRQTWRDGKRQKLEEFFLPIATSFKQAAKQKKEYLVQLAIRRERQKKIEAMEHSIRQQRYREDSAFEKVQKDASLLAEADR